MGHVATGREVEISRQGRFRLKRKKPDLVRPWKPLFPSLISAKTFKPSFSHSLPPEGNWPQDNPNPRDMKNLNIHNQPHNNQPRDRTDRGFFRPKVSSNDKLTAGRKRTHSGAPLGGFKGNGQIVTNSNGLNKMGVPCVQGSSSQQNEGKWEKPKLHEASRKLKMKVKQI